MFKVTIILGAISVAKNSDFMNMLTCRVAKIALIFINKRKETYCL